MACILLVDDDEPLRQMLRKAIEHMGHEVIEATNGAEAIEMCIGKPIDIVLTDLMMPKKDGLNAIRQLRVSYPSLKIIAMSGGLGHGADSYLELAQQLGAQHVLKKPFSRDDLVAVLIAALTS